MYNNMNNNENQNLNGSGTYPAQESQEINTNQMYTYSIRPTEPVYGSGSPPPTPPQPKKNSNGFKSGALILSCAVFSFFSAVGGTVAGNHWFPSNNDAPIITQVAPHTTTPTSTDGNSSLSISDVVEMTQNAVVEISSEITVSNSWTGSYTGQSLGSGVIISTDGYIVTNHHVIEGGTNITVRLYDGTSYNATLIGSDSSTDLAVLKIEAEGLTAATLGVSGDLKVGDTAIAIGNPLGELGGTVTSGIISAVNREITIENQTMTMLQTNAQINEGNSGGGLFNDSGELIGIVTAKTGGTGVEGLGFAIPMDIAADIVTDIMEHGYVTGRPALGITIMDITDAITAIRYGAPTTGVYVQSGDEGSLFMPGDRVLEVNGTHIALSDDIKTALDGMEAGQVISVTVERNGERVTFETTLRELKV